MKAAAFVAIALFCVLTGAGQTLFKLASMGLPTDVGSTPRRALIAPMCVAGAC